MWDQVPYIMLILFFVGMLMGISLARSNPIGGLVVGLLNAVGTAWSVAVIHYFL